MEPSRCLLRYFRLPRGASPILLPLWLKLSAQQDATSAAPCLTPDCAALSQNLRWRQHVQWRGPHPAERSGQFTNPWLIATGVAVVGIHFVKNYGDLVSMKAAAPATPAASSSAAVSDAAGDAEEENLDIVTLDGGGFRVTWDSRGQSFAQVEALRSAPHTSHPRLRLLCPLHATASCWACGVWVRYA